MLGWLDSNQRPSRRLLRRLLRMTTIQSPLTHPKVHPHFGAPKMVEIRSGTSCLRCGKAAGFECLRKAMLGWLDSNQRMADSKPADPPQSASALRGPQGLKSAPALRASAAVRQRTLNA